MKTSHALVIAGLIGICGLWFLRNGKESDLQGTRLPPLDVTYLKPGPAADLTGKPALVEFWATWCPPCRESIPHLNDLHKKYASKGFQIIGITEEDRATVDAFIAKMPMDYPVALDEDGKNSRNFKIAGIPHAFLVNKEGIIVWEGHPMQLKDSQVEALLK